MSSQEPVIDAPVTVVADPDSYEVLVWVSKYSPATSPFVSSVATGLGSTSPEEAARQYDPRWVYKDGKKVPNREAAACLVRIRVPAQALAPIPIEQIRQWEASQ